MNFLTDIIICSSDIVEVENINEKKIVLYDPYVELNFTYDKNIIKRKKKCLWQQL